MYLVCIKVYVCLNDVKVVKVLVNVSTCHTYVSLSQWRIVMSISHLVSWHCVIRLNIVWYVYNYSEWQCQIKRWKYYVTSETWISIAYNNRMWNVKRIRENEWKSGWGGQKESVLLKKREAKKVGGVLYLSICDIFLF